MKDKIPWRVKSLAGRRFGRLKVRFYAGTDKHQKALWCCVCDCGAIVAVPGYMLLGTHHGGRTVSCGCYRSDPEVRHIARLRMPQKKRLAICRSMRKNIKNRASAWSMTAAEAAQAMGVEQDVVLSLTRSGELKSALRKGVLRVSSQQVARFIAARERRKKSCAHADKVLTAYAEER